MSQRLYDLSKRLNAENSRCREFEIQQASKEKPRKSQANETSEVNSIMETPPGFEPGMADLQWA